MDERFRRTGQSADLNDAVVAAREAVAGTAPEHANYRRLSNFGCVLHSRYRQTRRPAELRDAVSVTSAPPRDRMTAARLWGALGIDASRLDLAADGLAAAVRLLPQLAWHGLPRATRDERLAEWSGLAADAAACAIWAGRPEQSTTVRR